VGDAAAVQRRGAAGIGVSDAARGAADGAAEVVVPVEFTVSAWAPFTAPMKPTLPDPALTVRFAFSVVRPLIVMAAFVVASVALDDTATLP